MLLHIPGYADGMFGCGAGTLSPGAYRGLHSFNVLAHVLIQMLTHMLIKHLHWLKCVAYTLFLL